ncbi:hypothetical protein ABW21_db0203777 [Orbilia brochopaga]|nr:hypothetical protein ABW21_db0203777 [Drechslerella brochopaga]
MIFFNIRVLTTYLVLCLLNSFTEGASIPGSSFGKFHTRQARTPICAATSSRSSFFVETAVFFQTTYTGFLNTAAGLLKALPNDLNTDNNAAELTRVMRCITRPTNNVNPMIYPQPPAGSSDCPRRDQDVNYIAYKNLYDLETSVGPLAPYSKQGGPSSFDPANCPQSTVTNVRFARALNTFADAVTGFLDQIDKQTCLVSLTSTSVTYKILFDRASQTNIDQITAFYSIQQIVNVEFNGAIYRGEVFDSAAMAAIKRVNDRFAQTKAFIETRKGCSAATRSRCMALGVTLFQEDPLTQFFNYLLGIPPKCPALGSILPGGGPSRM